MATDAAGKAGGQRRPRRLRSARFINKKGTGVSKSIKYALFFSNLVVWLLGGGLIGVGAYAKTWSDTWGSFSNVGTDPALMLIVVGTIVFFLGFCGAVGALRENRFLLRIFVVSMTILVVVEVAAMGLAFVFQGKVKEQISVNIIDAIKIYHTSNMQTDLEDVLDNVQKHFGCCGGKSPRDWPTYNPYFNCTRDTFHSLLTACGVPPFCCKNETVNTQCGYKVFYYPGMPVSESRMWPSIERMEELVYKNGCATTLVQWVKSNYIILGACALCIVMLQILSIVGAGSILMTVNELLETL
ncbi:tetraspanin-33-like [Sycon ciliatum]|uniref:tetraspanin-33-like n=1 Tax=Sycon ciliatum TaxID=27933 RepID=UPI0031F6B125|eukprot:scpid59642/ scgid7005/ Tetraspanin-33; Penumbra; Proerythroblast new membrane